MLTVCVPYIKCDVVESQQVVAWSELRRSAGRERLLFRQNQNVIDKVQN